MSRAVSPIPRFEDRRFLFYHRLETKESHSEIVNAHEGFEIVYVHEGSGQAILDGKVHAVRSGTLLFCPPFQLHHYKMEPNYVRTPLVFDPYLFDRYAASFPALQSFFHQLWKGKPASQLFSLEEEDARAFERLFRDFRERLDGASAFVQQEELALFLLELFRELRKLRAAEEIRGAGPAGVQEKREGRHIEQMMAWIEEHYDEAFSLDRLADSLHLSPFYASHLFSKETGCTLSQYILARRLRESCLLLTTTDHAIVEIGRMTGFNSCAYFCKQFKKKTGMSPQAYRKGAGRG